MARGMRRPARTPTENMIQRTQVRDELAVVVLYLPIAHGMPVGCRAHISPESARYTLKPVSIVA
jgi:hypothetical protein